MCINEVAKFKETEMVLKYSNLLQDILEYIRITKFEIDTFMLDKFWQCVSENSSLVIQGAVLEWLGYDSKKEYNNKTNFIDLLNSHNIEYTQIKHGDEKFSQYPDLVEDAKKYSKAALKSKQWIIMGSDDFKRMVMCLRTKRAGQIRDYYLAIEKLFKMYCEYTIHFNLRREKRALEEKQNTIDDLVKLMKEAEIREHEKDLQHKMERKEDEKRFRKLLGVAEDANEKLEIAEGNLENVEGNLRDVQNNLGVVQENLENVQNKLEIARDVVVPKPLNKKKLNKFGLVRMSPDYIYDENDPGYMRECNVVVIRRQAESFDFRVRQIRGYGNGTNRDAEILIERENPNSINLSNRLKEHEKDGHFYFTSACGIRYTETGDDELMIELVDQIHQSRMEYPK
ncbi:hypothetical protein 3TG000068 [Iridovirus CN01]|nr:hypothetical protein 4TH000151 [Iridovirus CN01]UPA43501.1 hypothetical protein 3TG000068 [Iridovirus CN01]UPA43697.1 hypothetical protein 1DG000105 [Iridovirus CN01]UPA43859.1 hypothetical protein L2A02_0105 [Iridovirus CN01]